MRTGRGLWSLDCGFASAPGSCAADFAAPAIEAARYAWVRSTMLSMIMIMHEGTAYWI